ncbi:MAG: preprotein translocase subunit YajC [Bacteroidia bacterium]|nr:MAG: preprotein translocase subunit YajC [Bacteroidia bacterium]
MLVLQAGGGSPIASIAMILLMIVVFYFFMIRPQMKRQKQLKKFQSELKKGDSVIVAGGIVGKIHEVRGESVLVDVDGNTKLRVLKTAVYRSAEELSKEV